MRTLKNILAELLGLFVDDERFALAIIVWVGVAWFASPRLEGLTHWRGPILFVGLAVILAESALRKARKASRNRSEPHG